MPTAKIWKWLGSTPAENPPTRPSAAQNLLDAVEDMNDGQRWRHMLDLGRRAATDAKAKSDIASLAALPNFHPRKLALMACCASGDADIILSCLTGASAKLAALAVGAAARFLNEATLAAVLPELPARRRRGLARACAKRRRMGVVESVFARLPLKDRASLLAFAGGDFVAARLADADFADGLAPADWARIAGRHPELVRQALAKRLDDEAEPSYHLLRSINGAVARAALVAPGVALALLQKAAMRAPFASLSYQRLAPLHPAEIAALILADSSERVAEIPRCLLRRVDDATREALLRRRGRSVSVQEFHALAPAARGRLHAAGVLEASRSEAGALPGPIVAWLPQDARCAEARRAWAAPQFGAHPERRLPYLAFLPFEEALGEAAPFVSQPDGDLRALAGAAIVASARYEPAQLPRALSFFETKRNEQDPVRLAMMSALAALPPTRWRDAHLPAISGIVAAALGARDCSPQTMDAAARLLLRMAPLHIDFVARELTSVTQSLGRVPRVDLQGRLSDAQMAVLTPHILPLLQIWRQRSHDGAILGFLQSFGRRLRAAPALLDFLAEMTGDPRRHAAGPALNALVGARATALLATLIPKLLRKDPSWILSPAVAAHLDRRRQDLLTDFLRPRVYEGVFSTHKTPVVPSFGRGFERWTQKQQTLYADSLFSIANSSKRSARELRDAVTTLAEMPAVDPAPIESLASLGAKDTALRDMALSALGRLDGGRGARVLSEALGDERGRIAIYALRRTVLDMPGGEAIAYLRRAPLQKITVAKEVVRLAGDAESDAGHDFLMEFLEKDDLHKDLRIAVLRALWSYLERDDTWRFFAKAAQGDTAAARATIRIPQERLSSHARSHLARHMALLLNHASPQVRLETAARLVAMPIVDEASALAANLRAMLQHETEEETRLAAAALTLCAAPDDIAALAPLFASVETPRALQAAIAALIGENARRGARVRLVARGLIDLLLGERRQIGLAMRLAFHCLSGPALLDIVDRMGANALLHAGAMLEAMTAAPLAARSRRGAELDPIEPALAAMSDPAARRIGLAILVARAEALGWSAPAGRGSKPIAPMRRRSSRKRRP